MCNPMPCKMGSLVEIHAKICHDTATIDADFNPIFRILLYFFLVFGAVLQRMRPHDVPHNSWVLLLSHADPLRKTAF